MEKMGVQALIGAMVTIGPSLAAKLRLRIEIPFSMPAIINHLNPLLKWGSRRRDRPKFVEIIINDTV